MANTPSRSGPNPVSGKEQETRTGTDRVLALFRYVAQAHEPVAMKAIIDNLELPKPTAHRLVSSLEEKGYLVRSIDRRGVIVGPELRMLALDVMRSSLSDIATHSILERISAELGETCNIGILSGSEVVYVDRVESVASPLRLQFGVGSRVPLHCTAIGKLLTSELSDKARRQLLGNATLPMPTPRTITDPEAMDEELRSIRERGYAIDDEEYILGVFCAAVPIVQQGQTVAALAVQAPKVRLNQETLERSLPKLRRAAEEIGRAMEAGRTGKDASNGAGSSDEDERRNDDKAPFDGA